MAMLGSCGPAWGSGMRGGSVHVCITSTLCLRGCLERLEVEACFFLGGAGGFEASKAEPKLGRLGIGAGAGPRAWTISSGEEVDGVTWKPSSAGPGETARAIDASVLDDDAVLCETLRESSLIGVSVESEEPAVTVAEPRKSFVPCCCKEGCASRGAAGRSGRSIEE